MPGKTRCAVAGCTATWALDGHKQCLMHAPYTGGLRPFYPRDCDSCSVAVTAPLEKESLTIMEPEFVTLHYWWANLVRLHQF